MTAHALRLRPAAPRSIYEGEPLTEMERFLKDAIFGVVAYEFGISGEELVCRRRHQRLIRGRAFVTWALRTLPERPFSYPTIGDLLGERDHSTVVNLHEKAILLRMRDAEFRAACERLAVCFSRMNGRLQ